MTDSLRLEQAGQRARVAAISQETRAGLDELAWRSHVKSVLIAVMSAEDDLAAIDREIAELSLIRASAEGEGGGASE